MNIFEKACFIRSQVKRFLQQEGASLTDFQYMRLLYVWKSVDDLIDNIAYDGEEERKEEK